MAIKSNPEHATFEEIEIAKDSSPDKLQDIHLSAIRPLRKDEPVEKYMSLEA